jgi:preprotein translocase subunit SecB
MAQGQPDGQSGNGGSGQQQLVVNAQYIKDLSFESPRTPQILLQQAATPPTGDINIDVSVHGIGPESYEVVLTTKATTKAENEPLFIIELAYAAIVTVRNVPQEMLGAVLMVEIPRLMFPFARNVIAQITRDGGFPPLMLNPIDFAELARRNASSQMNVPVPADD